MAVLVVVLLAVGVAVLVRGRTDTASSVGANGASPGGSTGPGGVAYCPGPEEPPPPSPAPSCIPFDWNSRVAENHAYNDEQPLTDAQRAAAQPKATALAAELARLAGKPATETAVRQDAANALGLPLTSIEARGTFDGPLKNILVGGGTGAVCVNGSIDISGKATAEVVGRTMDGTCLPGLGGH